MKGVMLPTRRRVLTLSGAAAAAVPMARLARADWQPSQRYPDPLVQVVDQSFARYRINQAKVEQLGTGFRWAEGPVWFGDGRFVLFSDIPNNRLMKWEEETGSGERVPQTVQLHQRQHPRSPGAVAQLRARHPPADPHRARRQHHRDCRLLPGQAAQLPQRRGRQVRRLDLVHRSALRHPGLLRGIRGQVGAADQPLPGGRQDRQAVGDGRRHQPPQRAGLLARRIEAVRGRGGRDPAGDPQLRRAWTAARALAASAS